MEIFNIDAFAKPKRALRMAGVDHPVRELSVQQFIDNLQAAVELDKKVEAGATVETMIAELNRSVDAVSLSIPSLDRAVVASWSPELIAEILRFIRGDLDKEVRAAEGAEKNAVS